MSESHLKTENYEVREDGTLCHFETKLSKDGGLYRESVPIANHAPIVRRLKKIDDGTEISEKLEIAIRRAFHETPFTMSNDQLFATNPNKPFGAACRIFLGRGFNGYYRDFIQEQAAGIQEYTVYAHTGVKVIDGKRVFLNGAHSVTESGLTDQYNVELENGLENYGFTDEKSENRYTVFKKLFELAPFSIMAAPIAYCFQSTLAPLYREIGIEPAFVLYIVGRTGSRKTSLSKLLLNFYGHFDYGTPSPAGFRDTVNSIEKKLSVCDGVAILVDDRIPTSNAYLKSQIDQVEQAILRLVGDKAGRARMYADGSLRKTYRPRAGVIITAEDCLFSVTESGVARAYSVELKPDDINLSTLTFIQENAGKLNQIMIEFIQYYLQHWSELKEKLYPAFVRLRGEAQSVGHGRLADAVAHLQLSFTVMCLWLIESGNMSEQEAASLKEKAWEIFMGAAQEQNKRLVSDKPTNLYLSALRQMKETGAIRFIDKRGHDDTAHPGKIGYVDEDFYYLIPDAAYSAVCKFYREQERPFPLSKARIHEHLVDEGFVKRGKNQITQNIRCCGVQGARLCLYRSALDVSDDEGE